MGEYMNFIIREMGESEYAVLDDFLYEAIFIPEGVSSPSREIIYQPELQVYADGFGTKDGDYAFVADLNGKKVGAVWTRIMNDYGHIDNDTPSFAISLYKEYRNKGIGTALMKTMLSYRRVLDMEMKNAVEYRKNGVEVEPFAYALSLVEGKWKLTILFWLWQREVLRYGELKRNLGKITIRCSAIS